MELVLGLGMALCQDIAEINGSIHKNFRHSSLGVEVSTLFAPEIGQQIRVLVGNPSNSESDVYVRFGLGAAYFRKPVPQDGTKLNVVLSAKLTYKWTPHYHTYMEARHYSNGYGAFYGTDDHENPGMNRFLAGFDYTF